MVFINDIREKRDVLYSSAPFTRSVKALKKRADLEDFTFSDLRLYGSNLTREGVRSIIAGETLPDVTLYEHRLCEAHRTLLARFSDRLEMGFELDNILLDEFSTIISEAASPYHSGAVHPPYREGTPLLFHLDYKPGDDVNIPAELKTLFKKLHRAELDGAYGDPGSFDFCLKAAEIHMGIVRVYPYREGFSEFAARVAMQYELVKAGYFPVDIGVSEPEYNRYTAKAIKKGNASEFAELLRIAVLKKLDFFIKAVERGV